MAADSAQKRYSAYDLGCPWRGPRVIPSGTVDAGERTAMLNLYSGITGESTSFQVAWARNANTVIQRAL